MTVSTTTVLGTTVSAVLDGPLAPRRLAIVRMLVCGFATIYVAIRAPHVWAVTRLDPDRFDPVGIVSMLTDRPLSSALVGLMLVATIGFGAAATLGWRHRWSGPAFGALLWWTLSYRLSWGQVLHTENLLVLHVMVLGLARSADALSLDAKRIAVTEAGSPSHRYAWPLQLMTLLTVLTYVIAAWAKIRNGGLEWMTGDVLRNQIAYDNLRKHLLGDVHSPLGGWLTRYGWMFPP
ncbi:MAG: hypothetical protein P8N02_10070, partial [Actinomycetota bacterium]|nr:hypothetical protein [Actinomycetota bacterium]